MRCIKRKDFLKINLSFNYSLMRYIISKTFPTFDTPFFSHSGSCLEGQSIEPKVNFLLSSETNDLSE